MFDRSLILAVIFLIWWFYPYFFQVQSVFANVYFLYQSWKYLVPICIVVCLLFRKTTLDSLSEYFPLRKIITTIFVDDTYTPDDWSPSVTKRQQKYYNNINYNNYTYPSQPLAGYGAPQVSYGGSQVAYGGGFNRNVNTGNVNYRGPALRASQSELRSSGPALNPTGVRASQSELRSSGMTGGNLIRNKIRQRQNQSRTQVAMLAASQGGRCAICQKGLGRHYKVGRIIPINQGGTIGPDNLQAYCPRCYLNR